MPNKTYANEWLEIARHHLESAGALLNIDHYTDIIGIELHQAIEKICKALDAFSGNKVERTHDLVRLSNSLSGLIVFTDDEMELLIVANDYYSENRYPGPKYELPPKEEITVVHDFTHKLFKIAFDYVNNDNING